MSANETPPLAWKSLSAREASLWIMREVFCGIATWEDEPREILLCPGGTMQHEKRDGERWKRRCSICANLESSHNLPMFALDPAIDLRVVKHIEKYWPQRQQLDYYEELSKILATQKLGLEPIPGTIVSVCFMGAYRPGNFSEAVYNMRKGLTFEQRRTGWLHTLSQQDDLGLDAHRYPPTDVVL